MDYIGWLFIQDPVQLLALIVTGVDPDFLYHHDYMINSIVVCDDARACLIRFEEPVIFPPNFTFVAVLFVSSWPYRKSTSFIASGV
jgi:hypothetical protein